MYFSYISLSQRQLLQPSYLFRSLVEKRVLTLNIDKIHMIKYLYQNILLLRLYLYTIIIMYIICQKINFMMIILWLRYH